MDVSICYADQRLQLWLKLAVEDETTVEEAISQSGILQRLPDIDLEVNKVGVFGKVVKLNKKLIAGDRIEIYSPITADPDTVERRF